ncbi:EAL domain-containing protein [Acidovorax sp. DW039]|uniref:bifunctional diguanylate cyclase/phosphodiesterase n=1 Tax=Acidovorax sp. DW039 TaxID=3095606 RepID=UPI00308A02B4|nr:EAL domain-containing protein [Acidovorax sp. DW039]
MLSLIPYGRYRHWLVGLAVALTGWAATYGLVEQQLRSVGMVEQTRFTQEARAFTDALEQRIAANTEIVYGLHNLFSLNPNLGRAEFERVVSELDAVRRYPGVRNLAFTKRVDRNERAAYEASIRAEMSTLPSGRTDYAIYPAGERSEYFVVHYIWPMQGNAELLGLDISAQPANLASMHFSRDSGKPVASAPFELIQEADHRNAFVIRIPVFGKPDTAHSPSKPFLGAVAATIRVYDVVRALESQGYLNGLSVAIEDAGSMRQPLGGEAFSPLLERTAQPLAGTPILVKELAVHDRRWRLSFQPTRSLLSPYEQRLPWVVGGGGALVALLVGALIALLVRQRTHALARALVSDEARRQSEERFRALFNQAAVGVAQVNSETGIVMRINQRYCDIVGYTPEELQGRTLREISHPEDQPAVFAAMARLKKGEIPEFRIEKRYFRKDGEEVWVDLTVAPMWAVGAEPDFHISMVQDITSRKRMEESLRTSEQRLRSILQRLPVGVCLVESDGRMSFRNERFVQICGYSEAEIPAAEIWWEQVYPDAEIRAKYRAAWQKNLDNARATDGAIEAGEYAIHCRDGQQRTVEIAGVMVGAGYLITMVDLSQRKAAEEEIRYLAFYDPLTRLPNRRLLMDRLQQALATSTRHGRSGALLLLDLDNFKTLNETQGHDKGDTLLLQVSHRLRSCLHEDDTLARQGGDEFVVVLEDLGDTPEEAAARAEDAGQKILEALREPYTLEGESHHSSMSMGITVFSGMRETVDELLKRADLAMYQAKSAGRDTLRFYDPQMQAAVTARAVLEADMRAGLAQGQFELYYQPQVEHGRITGAEALLRWRHPRDGFVSPSHFIPLAEESGLILPLGEWVLQQACERLAQWAQQPALSGLTLAVNVSPRQFHQGGFVPQVLAALARSGAEGTRLKLEMTEGLLLADVEDTIAKMAKLKSYGVGFSLDDFGTGYSSLAYLKRLPLNQLKIDQSFVRDVLTDPNDAAIARTVVALANSLGLGVIAEGVETEEQRAFLARNHCYSWQGYLLSKPVPVADFESLVRSHNG